jgi:DNA-binding IclR family transcriptional regulator
LLDNPRQFVTGGKCVDVAVIKTAGRVFEVLEHFGEVRRPLSVREISEHFGYPLSSTAVLMRSIASLGYLSYDQKLRAYFPTVRLAMLGEWVYELIASGGSLRPMLEELGERTDETVVLAVQNDIFSQYVEVIQSSHPLQLYLPPGTRRLMCASGTGWAMLAAQPDEAIMKMVHRTNLRLSKSETKFEFKRLMARIKDVRKQGYAFSRGTVTPGAGVIAVALKTETIGTHLAVGVAGVLERLTTHEDRIVKTMREVLKKHGMLPLPTAQATRPAAAARRGLRAR